MSNTKKKFKIVEEYSKKDRQDKQDNLENDTDEVFNLAEREESSVELVKPDSNNIKLNQKELAEHQYWQANEAEYPYLYPNLNDPQFNLKIAQKKEFTDTRYDGEIFPTNEKGEILQINEQAERMCNAEFELAPHQQFIRNFLSFQTPYNSLLLYHGLGSGKTCSAIGVAEEMRDYINQIGGAQRIIVVASPNVQDNFRLQLFDESRLKQDEGSGVWTIKTCTGSKLLREINSSGLSRGKIIMQINRLINNSYHFMGYTEFANYIQRKSDVSSDRNKNKDIAIKTKLQQHFSNRLIIIDEVHNIRITDDNKDKRVAKELYKLVRNVDNLRLLFLSATPLYNNYKEIIWLINIMNMNDGRSMIDVKDVFDANGNFVQDSGRNLLERKAIGYISYVRGDNPYTFPYRIWPTDFAPEKTVQNMPYPSTQLNGKSIVNGIQHIAVYITKIGTYQERGYNQIVANLNPSDLEEERLDALGYIQLQQPLVALNIVYPNQKFDELTDKDSFDVTELVGKHGLNNVMTHTETLAKTNYEYKPEVLETYGRIFSRDKIGEYSAKIAEICTNIMNSVGVVIVYSQYLDGGLVPIALALEEMGITRHGSTKSLFKIPPVAGLDLKTYNNVSRSGSSNMAFGKYVMITGDKMLSPNNVEDLKAATQKDNIDGYRVKVILISQAGSEGLDFKFIRQVHILEPWYNMSRIEQIIGRGVRNCSHKDLPFEQRNVELFLYGSQLTTTTEEAADLYVYRLAEVKTIQIGRINRILKEVSVDCLLNSAQLNFTAEKLQRQVTQVLSNGQTLEYQVGDKPFSSQCDYMETCIYQCKPVNDSDSVNEWSYTEGFITMNNDNILNRIRQIFKEGYFFKKGDLLKQINIIKQYPEIQIYSVLNDLITDKTELITDKYGRAGNLVNIGDYYLFQPQELTDEHISLYERTTPIPYKHDKIIYNITEQERAEEGAEEGDDDMPPPLEETDDDMPPPLEEGDDDMPPPLEEGDEDMPPPLEEGDEVKIQAERKRIEKERAETRDIKEPAVDPGKAILALILKNYITATTPISIGNDWYTCCAIVITNLHKDGIEEAILDELLICHIVQSLLFNDLFNLINYIYRLQTLSDFEQKIKYYFDSIKILTKGSNIITGILLHDWTTKAIQKLIILHGRKWSLATTEDYNDMLPSIEGLIVPMKSLNTTLGFMTNFKNNYMVFKVRQLDKKRNKGARCDQTSSKIITLGILNQIIARDPAIEAKPDYIPPANDYNPPEYTIENTKDKTYNSTYLCVLQEFLLRLYNYDMKYGKHWFLDPTQAVIMKI